MAHSKIATCCYCGTRAALTLAGQERHELACSSCGAPLHDLKNIPVSQLNSGKRPKMDKVKTSKVTPRQTWEVKTKQPKKQSKSYSKKKKKKSAFWDFAKDVIEEIFD